MIIQQTTSQRRFTGISVVPADTLFGDDPPLLDLPDTDEVRDLALAARATARADASGTKTKANKPRHSNRA